MATKYDAVEPEIQRVLQPGGSITLHINVPSRVVIKSGDLRPDGTRDIYVMVHPPEEETN